MEHTEEKLQEWRDHPKTQFLMKQYDATLARLEESKLMAEDPAMAELAAIEVKEIQAQLDNQYEEMDRIVESSSEEEAKQYGLGPVEMKPLFLLRNLPTCI